MSALALYKKAGLGGSTMKDWSTSTLRRITDRSQIQHTLKDLGEQLRELITNKEMRGSGWVFVRFQTLELHVARYSSPPPSGSPPRVESKNVKEE